MDSAQGCSLISWSRAKCGTKIIFFESQNQKSNFQNFDRRSTAGQPEVGQISGLFFRKIAFFGINWTFLHIISIDKDEKSSVVVIQRVQSQENYNESLFLLLKSQNWIRPDFDLRSTGGRNSENLTFGFATQKRLFWYRIWPWITILSIVTLLSVQILYKQSQYL